MKLVGTPTYDTANSEPPDAHFTFCEDGSVAIQLQSPHRKIILSKADWVALMRASGPMGAAEVRPASAKDSSSPLGQDDCG